MNEYTYPREYICPLCGGDVEVMIHPTYPPQTHYRCLKCGKHKDIWDKMPKQRIAEELWSYDEQG